METDVDGLRWPDYPTSAEKSRLRSWAAVETVEVSAGVIDGDGRHDAPEAEADPVQRILLCRLASRPGQYRGQFVIVQICVVAERSFHRLDA
jgi:hypothetical protein